jgi:hypothetical protein
MIKLSIPVPDIAATIGTYTHIQIGRAASSAEATTRTGSFVNLGAVVPLTAIVSAYDYYDDTAPVNQWHTYRFSNSTGTSGGSWSAAFRGLEIGYITVDEFRSYEMGLLDGPDGADIGNRKIERFIKVASSLIDNYTQQSFQYRQDTEKHKWNMATRRIYPYRRPISSLVALDVFVSNQQSAAFNVSDVFVNKDRNYFEITSLATVTYSLFPVMIGLGLIEPVAVVTYISGYEVVPNDVKDATAIITAHLLAEDALDKQAMGAMSELTVGSMSMKRHRAAPGVKYDGIPGPAAAILDQYVGANIR